MIQPVERNNPDELSDEALLTAIAGGAVWAMDSLYERYSRLLYSLVYRVVADHQVAEDLLQDAFVSIWKRSITFSPQSGPARKWLISIVHHRAIDYLRRVRRRSVLQEAPLSDLDLDETVAYPDVWDDAWRSMQSNQVRAALGKIPPDQRLVIELAYFQGLTHLEISQGLQLPLGTVKARMRLGLQHLKHALLEAGVDEV
jgi:RNA polymerase sigma factor (sigma-70 family)